MTSKRFFPPSPRKAIAKKKLVRPSWTSSFSRKNNMLWLDKNENPDPILAQVCADIIADISSNVFYSYPETGPLYSKLGHYLDLEPTQLLLSAGSDGLIRAVFEAFIEPGDVVVYSKPTFAMYSVYAQVYGAKSVTMDYHRTSQGPVLEFDRVIETITKSNAKLVCLPNPDSPTGTVFLPDQLRAIIEAAGKVGSLILIDEAYYHFYNQTVLPLVKEFGHLIVARSMGKAWGLAGFRIGYGASSTEITEILHKTRPMYEIGNLAAAVLERMLDREEDMLASVRRLEEGKNYFVTCLVGIGFKTISGYGNFLHVDFADRAEQVHAGLADVVYYKPKFDFHCLKGFSRFSFATVGQFEPVVERLRLICLERTKS